MRLGLNNQDISDLVGLLCKQYVAARKLIVGDLIVGEGPVFEVDRIEIEPDMVTVFDCDNNSVGYLPNSDVKIIERSIYDARELD